MRIFLLIFLFPLSVLAQEPPDAFRSTSYPIPRFVSLRADKVFMRTGPGTKYPIKWVYKKYGLPVEITLEYENWRKIRDFEGQEGWVHQSLLSGKRTGVIIHDKNINMYRKPAPDSRILAQLQPFVMGVLGECRPAWCRFEAQGYKGWVPRKFIWGIYEDEIFD